VSELRDPILSAVELLAERGLLPADQMAKTRSGSGKYDVASDGVPLADLFAKHAAAVKDKHPFGDDEFSAMREAAEWLLDRVLKLQSQAAAHQREDAPRGAGCTGATEGRVRGQRL